MREVIRRGKAQRGPPAVNRRRGCEHGCEQKWVCGHAKALRRNTRVRVHTNSNPNLTPPVNRKGSVNMRRPVGELLIVHTTHMERLL